MSDPIITDPDRSDYLTDQVLNNTKHRHLNDKDEGELAWLLWEAHNGDDSCLCLRWTVLALQYHDEYLALELMRNCIAEHPAGADAREWECEDQLGGLK